jgi:hypothetical protein
MFAIARCGILTLSRFFADTNQGGSSDELRVVHQSGLTNLLQTLSNVDSPHLSSQNAAKAIENSSPADIVKLSTAAIQLQKVAPSSARSQPHPIVGSSTFSALENALTSPANATGSATNRLPVSQLPTYQSSLQSAEADALLNPGPIASSTDPLISVLG